MTKKIFIVVETYRNDNITDTTELQGSFISRKKAIEKMNELYKERVADYTEAFHNEFNNEKYFDSFTLDYNEYETMCDVSIVEQELDETLDSDSDSNDGDVYELYAEWVFDSCGYAEDVIEEYCTEEEALKALHAEIDFVIETYEMEEPNSHWQFNDQTDANEFSTPTWRAERGQEYYHLEIRKVKWESPKKFHYILSQLENDEYKVNLSLF